VIHLTDAQLEQVLTQAQQVPRHLRDAYLRDVVNRLSSTDFDDGDVWRAALYRPSSPAAPARAWQRKHA
jgi:hypothetical protein